MKKITLLFYFLLISSFGWSQVYVEENFSDGSLPTDWTNNDIQGDGGVWEFDNPGDVTINAPMSEPVAILDSDNYGTTSSQNAALETPVFDATSATEIQVSFDYFFRNYGPGDSQAYVEVFDGNSWIEVFNYSGSTSDNPAEAIIDVSDELAGVATAQVRFRYVGDFDYYWIIDNIYIGAPPTCLEPTDVTVENVTVSSVDVAWTAGADETEWEIRYGAPGFDPTTEGESVMDTDGTIGETLSGLSSNTTYDVYVKSICGTGDESAYTTVPISFVTVCESISTLPFNETFNTDSSTENCWTVIDENEDGDAWNLNFGDEVFEGDEVAAFTSDFNQGSNDDYLVSPGIDLTGNEQLRYNYRVRSAGEPNDFEVLISTTGVDPEDFTEVVLPLAEYSNVSYMEEVIDLSAYTGTVYIAWRIPPDGLDGWRLYIDSVFVEEIPSCLKPSDVIAENITATSADISWTAGQDETEWEVLYGEEGFDTETEGTLIADDDGELGVSISDLSSATSYDIYVRAVCSEGDSSSWITSNFLTLISNDECGTATTLTLNDDLECTVTTPGSTVGATASDLGEDEEDVTGTPDNDVWFSFTATSGSHPISLLNVEAQVGTATDMGMALYDGTDGCDLLTLVDDSDPNSFTATGLTVGTTYYLRVYGWSSTNTAQTTFDVCVQTIQCPDPTAVAVENITSSSADISWIAGGDETEWEIIYGEDGFDQETEGTTVLDNDGTLGEALTDLLEDTNYDVYVKAICGTDEESTLVGPISFSTLPSCPTPTAVVVENITSSSADISWTVGLDETEWEVLYGEAGFDVTSEGTSVSVTETNLSLNSLDDGVVYDVYVKAICNESDESEYSTLFTFSTTLESGYCLPEATNESRFVNNFSTTNGIENITNNGSGFSIGGFGNFTDMIVGQETNATVDFTTAIEGGTAGFRIWVDWNQDGEFDTTEVMYSSSSYSATQSGSFIVPEDALEGNTVMRVVSHWLSSTGDVDPCETGFTYGEFEDYTFNVIVIEPCEVPTDVVVENVTDSSADITWTAGGGETEWEILYGEAGFDPETEGISVMDTDGTIGETISPLMANTPYDVYVRSICGEDNQSDWTEVETFTTEQLPCEVPTDVVVSNIVQTSADVSWTENGTATEWEILYGEANFDPMTEGTSVMDTDGTLGESLSGLTPETDYDVYVRAICSDDNMSDWSVVQSFTTEDLSVAAEQFNGFEFYPNPVKSSLSLKASYEIEQVTVYNLLGQKVSQLRPNRLTSEVNMSGLQSGTYLVSVMIDGNQKTFRVIKE